MCCSQAVVASALVQLCVVQVLLATCAAHHHDVSVTSQKL
jgi:hypothetical protein